MTTTLSDVADRREYVWNMLEVIGGTKPYPRPTTATETLGRCNALEAVGFIEYDQRTQSYELTGLGRAFIGGLYGGRSGHTNPYAKEPERSTWDAAAGMARQVKAKKRRRRA